MKSCLLFIRFMVAVALIPNLSNAENTESEIGVPAFHPFLSLMDTQLSLDCFAYPWPSGDNYEAIADELEIYNRQQFIRQPGLFIDRILDNPNPVFPNWCEPESSRPECISGITLVRPVQGCLFGPETDVNEFSPKIRLWFIDSETICDEFQPTNGTQCAISLVVEISEYFEGGHPAWKKFFGVYSLLINQNSEMVLVPVRHLLTKEDLVNFLQLLR